MDKGTKEAERVTRFYVTQDFDNDLLNMLPGLYAEIDKQANLRDAKIQVVINSDGGYVDTLKAFIDAFEYAQAQDVIVSTHVTGIAASCGSLLAMRGTKGHRTISRDSKHYVHLGYVGGGYPRSEIEVVRVTSASKDHFKWVRKQYQTYAEIPDLDEKLRDDHLFVSSRDSVRWGLADKVSLLP